jgi:hypothetical protein
LKREHGFWICRGVNSDEGKFPVYWSGECVR